jgi:hypothetical protein
MATFFQGLYPWSPGQATLGAHVFNQPVIITGQIQKQGGQRSFPPAITAPGTIASAGTVANSTGCDCFVYASATTGISAAKVLAYNGGNATSFSPAGTVPALVTGTYFVPGPGAIALTYTGTLTWVWQPA